MLNLLRMDLYRIVHSKSFYICFGALILCNFMTFGILLLLTNPTLRDLVMQYGAELSAGSDQIKEALSTASILEVYRQGTIGGGLFSVSTGILASLFTCTDFDCGFIKNIMAAHENKWDYILSKMCSLILINLLYLVGSFITLLPLNLISGGVFAWSSTADILFYLFSAWMVTNGLSALTMLICIVTRSKAAGIAGAICLNGGLIVMILNALLGLFGLQWLTKYSLYVNLASLPSSFEGNYSLQACITGLVFLVIYTVISKIVLTRRDI